MSKILLKKDNLEYKRHEIKKPVTGKGKTGSLKTASVNYNPNNKSPQNNLSISPKKPRKPTQKEIVLNLLNENPVTTLTLEEKHGIVCPTSVIHELRNQGNLIKTTYVRQMDQHGELHHRTGQYALEILNINAKEEKKRTHAECKLLDIKDGEQ